MIQYVCKYTPIELFAGFHEECAPLDQMPENFEQADRVAHANLCGFGRSVIEAVMEGGVDELVLVNCCDTMRRAYDIIKASGKCRFLYLLDLPHEREECEKSGFARKIAALRDAYAAYSGKTFDTAAFLAAFERKNRTAQPYVGLLGVRISPALEQLIVDSMQLPVENLTCLGNRFLAADTEELREAMQIQGSQMQNDQMQNDQMQNGQMQNPAGADPLYAQTLLSQIPCCRMNDNTRRNLLFLDQNLRGIIYHTIKFCDYYGFEYAALKNSIRLPILKIETDYTSQSMGQLKTRIEAFAETLGVSVQENVQQSEGRKELMENGTFYVAGIDSGSTSTDVVILDKDRKIVSSIIIPTGGGAQLSAEKSLEQALAKAGLERGEIVRIVTTGYGRAYIDGGDASITEITCHAKGAHFLNPAVRTIIDIGGQDSKAIRIDETGAVQNFLMNDKCAAGTGRFLEMMSRTLGITLDNMSGMGLHWKENIVISSMCTVFAESEVVSLVAQNKALPDIIHGLNCSVAGKVASLAGRLGRQGQYMMTGGVARNQGIVKALEEKLGEPLYICEEAQICGALGAALFAMDAVTGE